MKSAQSGASAIVVTAALSLAILIAAIGSYVGEKVQARQASRTETEPTTGIQPHVPVADADGNGTPDWQDELTHGGITVSIASSTGTSTSSDPASGLGTSLVSSLINGYVSLKQSDSYTAARGEQLADTLAVNFKAPGTSEIHTKSELSVDSDVSEKRILQYRADMRGATAVMVDLSAEPEFTLFARFISTGDSSWLTKLSTATEKYRDAEANMLKVRVPASAVDVHLRVVNATGQYAETLERLVRFSNDSLATMALLRTYNDAEREFLLAFDALAKYYVAEISTH